MAINFPIGVEVGAVYTIVGPDGERAVINDITDPDFVGFTSGEDGVTGLERAGVRSNVEDLPDGDGGVVGNQLYGPLAFTLKGMVYGEGDGSIMRQAKLLAATDAMDTDALLQWKPRLAPPVQVAFRAAQATRITNRLPKSFLVAGVSGENLIFSQNENSMSVLPGTGAPGGFTSPLKSPLVSNAAVVGQVLVNTLGTKRTWPVFEITGPGTNPSIQNVTTGRTMNFNIVLAAGETLVIDTNPRHRSVKLGGVTNRYSAYLPVTSRWIDLARGVNDIRVGFNTYSVGASLTVRWRDAWG